MKKIVACLLVLGMLAGCATVKDFFCSNRTKIETAISTANNLINSITAVFGSAIPPEYQLVVAAAQQVITNGEAMLAAKWCPTDQETGNLLNQSEAMQVSLKAAMLKQAKK